jgi:hypothetical protein
MNRTDALELAERISRTWRSGPHPDEWVDELVDLDHDRARATFRELRRTTEQPPSIARFLAAYRAQPDDRGLFLPGTGWVPHRGGSPT